MLIHDCNTPWRSRTPSAPSRMPPGWGWVCGQLALHLRLTHQQWERSLRWSRSHGDHRYDYLTSSQLLLLHLLVKQFDCPHAWLLGKLQILWRVVWIILVNMPWAWASFLVLSRWSFSTLVAILAMKVLHRGACGLPPPVSPPLLFLYRSHLRV